ncbi:MAG: hypothetical protein LBI31_05265 [Zoogloeaceae bacterium]|nr:hypothetical protein [Zoogloeaceae bacterium]
MQDYSNIWKSYLEFYQRSWLDVSRLWFSALPDAGKLGVTKDPGKEGALSPAHFANPENWMALLNPWMPKVEANIEPFMEEAARVSMRIFMPWQSDPFWVEALVSKQDQSKAAKLPAGKKADAPKPAELAVTEAVKRSRTQD